MNLEQTEGREPRPACPTGCCRQADSFRLFPPFSWRPLRWLIAKLKSALILIQLESLLTSTLPPPRMLALMTEPGVAPSAIPSDFMRSFADEYHTNLPGLPQ
jgi:hypothetical protein